MTAQELFDAIGGKDHAVKRPKDTKTDRALRKLIYEAQSNGEIIINVGDGEGYFKADLSDPEQYLAYKHYINSQKSRIRKQARNITAMEMAAGNIDQLPLEGLYE